METKNAFRPGKQDRSRRTLERLVEASKTLLEEKSFDEIAVAEIADRAGSSVGAFYARFRDKESLLEYLLGVVRDDMKAEGDRCIGEKNWEEASLGIIMGGLMDFLVRGHRRHRVVLRALFGRSLGAKPGREDVSMWEEPGPIPFLVRHIARRRGEINHPDPDVAVELGLAMALSTVRERILFPELGPGGQSTVPITDAVFVGELTRAFSSFLGMNTEM